MEADAREGRGWEVVGLGCKTEGGGEEEGEEGGRAKVR